MLGANQEDGRISFFLGGPLVELYQAHVQT